MRLGSYDALAAAALNERGEAVSTWWPVAYAVQRLGDAKGAPALVALLNTPGRYTAAFAARGLGVMKAASALAPLRQIVEQRRADPAVIVQAIRALAAIGDSSASDVLTKVVGDLKAPQTLRIEVRHWLSIRTARSFMSSIRLSRPKPAVRGRRPTATSSSAPSPPGRRPRHTPATCTPGGRRAMGTVPRSRRTR